MSVQRNNITVHLKTTEFVIECSNPRNDLQHAYNSNTLKTNPVLILPDISIMSCLRSKCEGLLVCLVFRSYFLLVSNTLPGRLRDSPDNTPVQSLNPGSLSPLYLS
ncbi:hypothetical protein NPIL_10171 [Nephila pilipes]|uniref:Uncharacterized protein n=1 Tax=Nephila pilipes TaxID=299642 RepID=A0A8X6U9G1_NEPPI|nr:hypothetical protein NPIL_10171 [Nephila pilipes]